MVAYYSPAGNGSTAGARLSCRNFAPAKAA